MSTENITAFFTKAETDTDLQQKLGAIHEDTPELKMEALAKLSEEAGTPFTVEEFLHFAKTKGEATDAELGNVVGGFHMNLFSPFVETAKKGFDAWSKLLN